jgi:hypothetical protein
MTRETQQRLRHDRQKLLDTLRDFRGGKMPHISKAESGQFLEAIQRRIDALDARIEKIPDD